MSNSKNADKNSDWVPNNAYDPVVNPFLTQNLYEKNKHNFLENSEEKINTAYQPDPKYDQELKDELNEFNIDDIKSEETRIENEKSSKSEFELENNIKNLNEETSINKLENKENELYDEHLKENLIESESLNEPNSLEDIKSLPEENKSLTEQDILEPIDICSEKNSDFSIFDQITEISHEIINQTEQKILENSVIQNINEDSPHSENKNQKEDLQDKVSDEELERLIDSVREEEKIKSWQEGFEAGIEKNKSENSKKFDIELKKIRSLQKKIKSFSSDPKALFEPLKKLSLHIAEQLIRGELSNSGKAVSNLVENSLKELSLSDEKSVVINLHPEDLEQYRSYENELGSNLIFRQDSKLSRGSVKITLDGSKIEDYIENRIEELKSSLEIAPSINWNTTGSVSMSSRLANKKENEDIQDVEFDSNLNKNKSEESNNDLKEELEENHD